MELENLKSIEITSIDQQISGIKTSISDLQVVDAELKAYIQTLQDGLSTLDGEVDEKYEVISGEIASLKEADAALSKRIDDLKNYCDQQTAGTREWVSATFATLEQHSAVLEEIAAIKLRLGELGDAISNLDASLSKKISDSENKVMAAIGTTETSVKSWVNEQLSGYYTIAAADAKLKLLEDAYKAGDASLAGDIKTLVESLSAAKSDLTAAYQKAIADAISENNGTINEKIADDIAAAADNLQEQINTINTRIDALESRIAALEASVAELIGMVQSIVVVPDYSDGSVKMTYASENTLRFEVYPLSAAKALAEKGPSVFSLDYIETETKASMFNNIPITSVSFNGEVISVVADGSGLSERVKLGGKSANARLHISNGVATRSSEYFNLSVPPVPEYVDMGLSVYWASFNLSASGFVSSPELPGDYFAWGETSPKSDYSAAAYKWGKSYNDLTKYNYDSTYGVVDNKTVLEPNDDAARIILGDGWRMPTNEEWKELEKNCSMELLNLKGTNVYGILVTGPSGNSIFLPATGQREGLKLVNPGSEGYYWSSTLSNYFSPANALGVHLEINVYYHTFAFEFHSTYVDGRSDGFSVRPVFSK